MTKIDLISLAIILPSLGFTVGWISRGLKCDYFSIYMLGFLHGINKDYTLVKSFPKWMIDEFFGRKSERPSNKHKPSDKPVGPGTGDSGTSSD